MVMSGGSVFLIITPVHAHRNVQQLRRHIPDGIHADTPLYGETSGLEHFKQLLACTTPNRVFNGPSLRETPPTDQTTETVKSRIISLEILLHAQRQTIMRQGRSAKTVPVYISAFIHQRHAVTSQMLFDPFR